LVTFSPGRSYGLVNPKPRTEPPPPLSPLMMGKSMVEGTYVPTKRVTIHDHVPYAHKGIPDQKAKDRTRNKKRTTLFWTEESLVRKLKRK
jgi:hypothetical protein